MSSFLGRRGKLPKFERVDFVNTLELTNETVSYNEANYGVLFVCFWDHCNLVSCRNSTNSIVATFDNSGKVDSTHISNRERVLRKLIVSSRIKRIQ